MLNARLDTSQGGVTTYTSDWKANNFWSPRERLEVLVARHKPVRVRIATQYPSSQALHSVASFLGGRPLAEETQKIDEYQIKSDALDSVDPATLTKILAQKDKALSSVKRELLDYISSLVQKTTTVPPSPVETSFPIASQRKIARPAPLTSLQKRQKRRAEASLEGIPKPIHGRSEEEIKQRLGQMKADLAALFEKEQEEEKLSWIGKLYDKSAACALWMMPGLKTWAKQAVDFLAVPLPCQEEDIQDKELMLRCEEKVKQWHAELEQLAKESPLSVVLKEEGAPLKQRFEGITKKINWLQSYFKQSEELDERMEKTGDQMLDLHEGKLNFSPESFIEMLKQVQAFESLAGEVFDNPEWQERIKRKCAHQIKQAEQYLEDLMEQIHAEMGAEIEEAIAHQKETRLNVAEKSSSFFHLLQEVHAVELCYKNIEQKHQHFLQQIKSASNALGSSGKAGKRLGKELTSLEAGHKRLQQGQQKFPLKPCYTLLVERLDKLKNPADALLKLVPVSPSKDSLSEMQAQKDLAALEAFANAAENGSNASTLLLNAVKEMREKISQEISQHSLFSLDEMAEAMRKNRPVLTRVKSQILESHKKGFETETFSPTQKTVLRVVFTYLQAWDLFSPLLGKVINPVGKKDYDYYVNMMGRTKDRNSAEYRHYFEMARGFLGADQEFLTMYDRFLQGNMTFGFTQRFSSPEKTNPLSETFCETMRPFVPESVSSWFSKFFATDADERRLLNSSEWEKWAYRHIYPDIISQAYDQLIRSFENYNPKITVPSQEMVLTGNKEEAALYSHYYKLYQKAVDLQAHPQEVVLKQAYESTLMQARGEVGHLRKYLDSYESHLQAYLQSKNLVFSTQPESVENLPLGGAVLRRLEEDSQFKMQVEQLSNFYGKQAGQEVLKEAEPSLAEHRSALSHLRGRIPLEFFSPSAIKAWLGKLEAMRQQYANSRKEIRASFAAAEWKERVSLEKLKIFLTAPIDQQIDEEVLAHMMGEHFIDRQNELIDPVSLLTFQLQILKQRIQLLQENPLCTQEEPAAFCREYLNNSLLVQLAGQSPILPFLEKIETKLQETMPLKKAFLLGREPFLKEFSAFWSTLKSGESAILPLDNKQLRVFEFIKQPDERLTLRFYDLSNHQWHIKKVNGQEKTRPYIEINDIKSSNQALWMVIDQFSKKDKLSQSDLEDTVVELESSWNLQESPQDQFVESSQKGYFHTLLLALRSYFADPKDLSRFAFETQFKAIYTYHQLHQNKYTPSQEKFILGVCQSFAGKLDLLHQRKIINGEEIKFSIDFLEQIQYSLLQMPRKGLPSMQIPIGIPPLLVSASSHNTTDTFLTTVPVAQFIPTVEAKATVPPIEPGKFKESILELLNLQGSAEEQIALISQKIVQIPLEFATNEPLWETYWERANIRGNDVALFKKLNKKFNSLFTGNRQIKDYLVSLKILAIVDRLIENRPPHSLGEPFSLSTPAIESFFDEEALILPTLDEASKAEFLVLKEYWKEKALNYAWWKKRIISPFVDYVNYEPFLDAATPPSPFTEKWSQVQKEQKIFDQENAVIDEESAKLAAKKKDYEQRKVDLKQKQTEHNLKWQSEIKLSKEISELEKLVEKIQEKEGRLQGDKDHLEEFFLKLISQRTKEQTEKSLELQTARKEFMLNEGNYLLLLNSYENIDISEIFEILDNQKEQITSRLNQKQNEFSQLKSEHNWLYLKNIVGSFGFLSIDSYFNSYRASLRLEKELEEKVNKKTNDINDVFEREKNYREALSAVQTFLKESSKQTVAETLPSNASAIKNIQTLFQSEQQRIKQAFGQIESIQNDLERIIKKLNELEEKAEEYRKDISAREAEIHRMEPAKTELAEKQALLKESKHLSEEDNQKISEKEKALEVAKKELDEAERLLTVRRHSQEAREVPASKLKETLESLHRPGDLFDWTVAYFRRQNSLEPELNHQLKAASVLFGSLKKITSEGWESSTVSLAAETLPQEFYDLRDLVYSTSFMFNGNSPFLPLDQKVYKEGVWLEGAIAESPLFGVIVPSEKNPSDNYLIPSASEYFSPTREMLPKEIAPRFLHWQPKRDSFEKDLQFLLKKVRVSKDSKGNILDIREFVRKIPFNDPTFLVKDHISNLRRLSVVHSSIFKDTLREPADYLVQIKILTLVDKLIHEFPLPSLGEPFSLYVPNMRYVLENKLSGFQLLDPEWEAEFQAIKDYWKDADKNSLLTAPSMEDKFFFPSNQKQTLTNKAQKSIEVKESELKTIQDEKTSWKKALEELNQRFDGALDKREKRESIKRDLQNEEDALRNEWWSKYQKLDDLKKIEKQWKESQEKYRNFEKAILEDQKKMYLNEGVLWQIAVPVFSFYTTDFVSSLAEKKGIILELIEKIKQRVKVQKELLRKPLQVEELHINGEFWENKKELEALNGELNTKKKEVLEHEKLLYSREYELREKKGQSDSLSQEIKAFSNNLEAMSWPQWSYQCEKQESLDKLSVQFAKVQASLRYFHDLLWNQPDTLRAKKLSLVGDKERLVELEESVKKDHELLLQLDNEENALHAQRTEKSNEIEKLSSETDPTIKSYDAEKSKIEKAIEELEKKENEVRSLATLETVKKNFPIERIGPIFNWITKWVERQGSLIKSEWEKQTPEVRNRFNTPAKKALFYLADNIFYFSKDSLESEKFSSSMNLPREFHDLRLLTFHTDLILQDIVAVTDAPLHYNAKPFSSVTFVEAHEPNVLQIFSEEDAIGIPASGFMCRTYAQSDTLKNIVSSELLLKSMPLGSILSSSGKRLRYSPNIIPRYVRAFDFPKKSIPESLICEILELSSFPETQVKETLSFFTKNMSLLSEEKYRQLLEYLLLEPGLFIEEFNKSIENSRKFAEDTTTFIHKALAFGFDARDPLLTSFVLNLNHRLHSSFKIAQKKWPETLLSFKDPFLNSRHEWRERIRSEKSSFEEKGLFYRDLALSYLYQRQVSSEEIQELLSAVIGFRLSDLPSSWMSEAHRKDLVKLLEEKQELFTKEFEGRQDQILNGIYQYFYPHALPGEWEQKGPSRYVRKGSLTEIDTLIGQLTEKQGKPVYLPKAITESWPFKNAEFKGIQIAKKLETTEAAEKDVYEIIGPKGIKYRIVRKLNEADKEKAIVLQREINGRWHQRTSDKALFNLDSVDLNYFISDYDVWWHSSPLSLFLQIPNGELKYRIGFEGRGQEKIGVFEITPEGKDKGVTLGQLSQKLDTNMCPTAQGPESFQSLLERFEHPHFIYAFRNNATQELTNVNFKRFGLQFAPQKIESKMRLKCQQLPAYLAENPEIPLLDPVKHYLVLEAKQPTGEMRKMVLFAPRPLAALERQWESQALAETFSHNSKKKKNTYYLYDVDPETQALISREDKGRFYLAMLALWKHDYKAAYEGLSQFSLSTHALKKEEKLILQWIATLQDKNQDLHPQANAVRLKALALLSKNDKKFPSKEKKSQQKEERNALNAYADYLQAEEQCRLVPLTFEEETLIIRDYAHQLNVVDELKHHLILQRMRQLNMPFSPELVHMGHFEKVQRPSLQYASLRFSDLYVKNFKIDKPFLKDYAFMRQMPSKSWLEARLFVAEKTYKSRFFSWLMPLDTLNWYLVESQKTYSKETALQNLLLQAVLMFPDKFPEELLFDKQGQLDGKFFNEKVLKPLGELVLKDANFQAAFRVIPKAQNSLSDEAEKPETQFDSSVLVRESDFGLLLKTSFPNKFLNQSSSTIEKVSVNPLQDIAKIKLSDSIAQRELAKLYKDMDLLEQKRSTLHFELTSAEDFQKSHLSLIKRGKKLQRELRDLKVEILISVNGDTSPFDGAHKRSQAMAQKNKPLSFDELIYFLLKKEMAPLHKRNPNLSLADVDALLDKVKNFMVLSIHHKQVETVKGLMNNVQEVLHKGIHSAEVIEVVQELGQEISRARQYNLTDHPEYIVLEYYGGFMLRETQLQLLDTLKIVRGSITQPQHLGKVAELLMGAGKTSVVFPLLALFNADGERLAMGVMPKQLIESMARGLQTQMKAFKQSLEVMQFDRKSPFDEISLKYLLDKFYEIRHSKKFLLTANESLQALFLKMAEKLGAYVEAKQKGKKVDVYEKEITLFIEIFKLFKESGSLIIDEVDSIFDVLKSFHFTIGAPKRLTEQNPILTQTTKDFFLFLVTTPGLESALKYTTESAFKVVKAKIIDTILAAKFMTDGEWHHFMTHIDDKHKPLLKRFLNGEIENDILAFTNNLDKKIQDILAILKEEINELLPLTASKNLFEHYGPSKAALKKGPITGEDLIAIPYHQGRCTPAGTQFGTELEILNYIFHMYLELGVSVEIVQAELEELQQEFGAELIAKGPEKANLRDLRSYRTFLQLTDNSEGLQLGQLSSEDVEKITEIVNKSKAKILSLVYKHVIPEIRFYEKQLNADSQLFGTLFKEIQGMTGTLWNAETYTKLISFIPSSDTSAKTIDVLLKNTFQENGLPLVDIVNKPSNLSDSLLKGFLKTLLEKDKHPSSLIDAANILRGIPNEEVAKLLLEIAEENHWDIHGVVFYDQDDNLKVMQHVEDYWEAVDQSLCRVSKDQLLVYWDQSHTTGSDIKVNGNMKAAVSVGRHTFLRDLLQAVWRLRKLDKSQKVYFIVTQEDGLAMRETLHKVSGRPMDQVISLKDLILYTLINQSQRQGADNYRSFKQKIQALLLEKALKSIFEVGSTEAAAEIYVLCKDLFESIQNTRPYEQYVKVTETLTKEKLVKMEVANFLKSPIFEAFKMPPLSDKWDIQTIENEINFLATEELKHLPDTIVRVDSYNKERSIQTQQQTLTLKQKQRNVELTEESVVFKENVSEPSLKALFRPAPQYLWDEGDIFAANYFQAPTIKKVLSNDGYADEAPAFYSQITCSPNLAYGYKNGWLSSFANWIQSSFSEVDRFAPFGEDSKSLNKVLIVQNKGSGQLNLLLIDNIDEYQWKKKLIESSKSSSYESLREQRLALYDLTTGIYVQGSDKDRIDEAKLEADPKFLDLKVQIKFLAGEISYTSAELESLEKWLLANDYDKLEKFFRETVAPWRSLSEKTISRSDLGDLFKRLVFKTKVSSSFFTQFFKLLSR